jgi:hypothetical protein
MMYASYDRLWKMRTTSDKLSDSYAKYYGPTEQLTFEITVCSSKQSVYIQKDNKRLGTEVTSCVILRDIGPHTTQLFIRAMTGNMQLPR